MKKILFLCFSLIITLAYLSNSSVVSASNDDQKGFFITETGQGLEIVDEIQSNSLLHPEQENPNLSGGIIRVNGTQNFPLK